MLNKYQFIKKLITLNNKNIFKAVVGTQPHQAFSFISKPNQAKKNLISTFSTFPYSSIQQTKTYHEDLFMLKHYSREQLAYGQEVMSRYATCKDASLLNSQDIEWISALLFDLMSAFRDERNHDKALRYMRELEDFQNKIGNKDTYDVAYYQYLLACEYIKLQDYNQAKIYLDNVERICQVLGDNPEARNLQANSWVSRGNLYRGTNQEQKALEIYQQVLANINNLPKEEELVLLIGAYGNMQDIYLKRNDLDNFLKYIKKYLDVATQHYGENSGKVLSVYFDSANYLFKQNQFPEALKYAKKALQIANQASSNKDQQVAWCHFLLGNIYKCSNDCTKALEHYEKALKIIPKDLQEFQSEIYSMAAGAHQSLGNNSQAEAYFKKSNELLIKANQGNDVGVAETYIQQAHKFRNQENFPEAQASLRKALDIFEKLEPLDYSKIADLYGLMGQLSYGDEDWSRALESFKDSEKYLEKFDAKPSRVQYTYLYMAIAYRELEKYDESLKYFQKILQSAQATGEIRHLATTYYEMGTAYEDQGKFKDALEAFQKAQKYEEQHLGKEHPDTEAIAEKVVEIQKKVNETNQTASKISGVLKSFKK